MPCPGGLSSYDCFVLKDQNIKSGSYTRLKHLLHCVFWLKRLTEVLAPVQSRPCTPCAGTSIRYKRTVPNREEEEEAIGTFYRDQNCESAIWQLKFSGHNGRRNAHTCRTFLILIGFADRTERF